MLEAEVPSKFLPQNQPSPPTFFFSTFKYFLHSGMAYLYLVGFRVAGHIPYISHCWNKIPDKSNGRIYFVLQFKYTFSPCKEGTVTVWGV